MLQSKRKIFGIGLSKTGTTSLSKALEVLDIACIHFPSDKTTFEELRSGNYRLTILEKYQAAVDTPVAIYYAQLDCIYPGSKFILTVRQIDSWLQSAKEHFGSGEVARSSFTEFIRTAAYGTPGFNENRFRFVYETHFRNVCEYFKDRPGDLLIVDICNGDGWEKLCPFLGVPIPDVPFPQLNQTLENQKWNEEFKAAVQKIRSVIPAGVDFALVGHGKFGTVPGALPPLNRDGLDWGAPADDASAIEEVEQLRRNGSRFLVFLFPHFWWFDYYAEFARYLHTNFRALVETDQLIVFALQ